MSESADVGKSLETPLGTSNMSEDIRPQEPSRVFTDHPNKEQEYTAEDQEQPLLGGDPTNTSLSTSNLLQEAHEHVHEETSTSGRQALELQGQVSQASILRRVNWHIIPMFFSLAMLCSLNRSNLSFVASELGHDLGFSDEDYGYGSGIFFVGYALFAVPSTFVCAHFGAPLFLGSIMIVWGGTAALFSVMQNTWQFFVLRFALGLAESGAYPGMWYHLALFYTEQEMGPAYTVIATASSLSGVAGGPLAGELLMMDGLLGARGWQWLFVLESIPAILLGLATIFWLAKDPSTATFLTMEEREWLQHRKLKESAALKGNAASPNTDLEEDIKHASLRTFVTVIQEWRIWWLSLIWAIVCFGMDGLISWIPLLIESIIFRRRVDDLDEVGDEDREELNEQSIRVARLSSIPFGMAAVGMVAVAFSAKRLRERHWHIGLPLLAGTGVLVALPLVEDDVPWLAFVCLCGGAVCVWAPHGPLLSWPAAILEGTAAAAGFAFVKMVGSFASFVGNALIGELHHVTGNFAVPVFLLAGLLAVGSVLAFTFREPGYSSKVSSLPLYCKLRNRLGMKRSLSDPSSFYDARSFTGSLSTIEEDTERPCYYGAAQYEMPMLPLRLDNRL